LDTFAGQADSLSLSEVARRTGLPLTTTHRLVRELASRHFLGLAIIDGMDAVYVERVSGRDSVHVLTRPGLRLPVHATGVGLVLLAHSTPETQEAVLNSPLTRFTRYTITDRRRLRRILADVRQLGYAISERQIENVSSSIAAPVRDSSGSVVAAISVVVKARDNDPSQYVPAVMAAARGISRALA
jgi:DNA-binding IclR family transcriptional regulator